MDSVKVLVNEYRVILLSLVTGIFSLVILLWCRRRNEVPVVIADTREETARGKKAGKTKRKTKADKVHVEQPVVADQEVKNVGHIPNGIVNKPKKLTVVDKPQSSVKVSEPVKSENAKKSKSDIKKQEKTVEKLADISDDWTVAGSKKKPKVKKESSPVKVDNRSVVEVKRTEVAETLAKSPSIEGFDTNIQAKEEVAVKASLVEIPSEMQNDREKTPVDTAEDVDFTLQQKTPVPAEVDGLVASTQDGSNSLVTSKNKKKKQKKNNKEQTSGAAESIEKDEKKTSEPVQNREGETSNVEKTSHTVVVDSKDDESRKDDVSELPAAPAVAPPAVADEKSTTNTTSPPVPSVAFDELGDEPAAVASQSKKKKKPRREN